MNKDSFIVVYLIIMISLIVSLDFLFLRHHFTLRLIVNISIVVIFILLYLLIFKNHIK